MHKPDPAVYPIHRVASPPPLDAAWDDPAWAQAVSARVVCVNNAQLSSDHHPATTAQLLYDDSAFYLRFRVEDFFVRAVHQGNQSSVWKDSCVEFFFQPAGAADYLNLETNAGGNKLLHRNWFDVEGKRQWSPIPDGLLDTVVNWHSLPSRIEPERAGPVTWYLSARLPFTLLASVWGPVQPGPGVRWRGNFYKCADETSHPHWLSWNPVASQPFSFHTPETFGTLVMQ